MENKDKLHKVAHTFERILYVVRIFTIIGIVATLIGFIIMMIVGGTGALTKIYESNPTEMAKISFTLDERGTFLNYYKTTLGEIYANGDLDKFAYQAGVYCIIGTVECAVFLFIVCFFRKVFLRLQETETPFDLSLAKNLRIAFILISILVALQSFVLGIVVGGLLACMYVIFLYGCKLQENEDTTL